MNNICTMWAWAWHLERYNDDLFATVQHLDRGGTMTHDEARTAARTWAETDPPLAVRIASYNALVTAAAADSPLRDELAALLRVDEAPDDNGVIGGQP
jgi:hypothetical protein